MPSVSIIAKNQELTDDTSIEFQADVPTGEVLFDGLDNAGHSLPHGCLAGSCGSCKIKVLRGAEFLNSPGAIERDTISHVTKAYLENNGEDALGEAQVRMACRTRIESDGEIVISVL